MKSILVIGAGTMGRGIAKLFALKGYPVSLFDKAKGTAAKAKEKIAEEFNRSVENAQLLKIDTDRMLERLTLPDKLSEMEVDLAVEAIVEDIGKKSALLKELEPYLPPAAIIATNTSSLSVSALAGSLARPERFLGLHFFNPAVSMPLVELVPGGKTSPETVEQIRAEMTGLGKTTITVKDSPGFVVNRVARPFYLEALRLAEEGASGFESTDRLCRSAGFKMGPFELMDLIGIDINYSVSLSVYQGFHQEPRFRPSSLQKSKVDAGELGRKSGRGYYTYP